MARKPVLEGGKRDEIIAAATTLFFTEGYEATSVRKVLKMVDGEVGMFYHYFSSKEELFDVVVDRFFRQYETDFKTVVADVHSPEALVDVILASYESAMERYRLVDERIHWTIRLAFHERTLHSLIPVAAELLQRFGYAGAYPMDIAAAKAVADMSAVLHSESFSVMDQEGKKELLLQVLQDMTQ